MRNFLKIAENIDVTPILSALASRPHLWGEHRERQVFPGSAHAQVDDIWCRFSGKPTSLEAVIDGIDAVAYPAWQILPVKPFVLDLMRRVDGVSLGAVILTRLPPGATISEHVDEGERAAHYDRYHIVLQSLPGCVTHSGGESVATPSGTAWWFNNRVPHSVVNNSADDRINMVVDIEPC